MAKPLCLDIDMDYFVSPINKSSVNGVRLHKDEYCKITDAHQFFDILKTKITIPNERHLFTNHKKSYIYWWMKGIKVCILIHIDAHSDLYRNKQRDLRLLNDMDMNCDDYLWKAIRDDFINEIYWICPENSIDLNDVHLPPKIINPQMIKEISVMDGFINIDFDIINRLGAQKTIQLHILSIDNLFPFSSDAVMMTMATSPEFIPSMADTLIDDINSIIGFSEENYSYVKNQHVQMLNITQEDIKRAEQLLNKYKI